MKQSKNDPRKMLFPLRLNRYEWDLLHKAKEQSGVPMQRILRNALIPELERVLRKGRNAHTT